MEFFLMSFVWYEIFFMLGILRISKDIRVVSENIPFLWFFVPIQEYIELHILKTVRNQLLCAIRWRWPWHQINFRFCMDFWPIFVYLKTLHILYYIIINLTHSFLMKKTNPWTRQLRTAIQNRISSTFTQINWFPQYAKHLVPHPFACIIAHIH